MTKQFTPEEIAAIRRQLGESQAAFGKRFNVSGMTIWRWESGENTPKPAHMAILAEIQAGFTEKAVSRRYGGQRQHRRYS